MVIIYELSHPITGEPRYVGKTVNIDVRLKRHIYEARVLKKNHYIHRWIRSLGSNNPILTIIDKVHEDEWIFWERYWIAQYKQWGMRLTNTHIGGTGGFQGLEHTELSKQKISKKKKGMIGLMKGKKHSAKGLKNIRLHVDKRDYTNANNPKAKQVVQIDVKTNTIIKVWSCIKEAQEALKTTSIYSALSDNCKTAGGYKWEYVN